MKHLRNTALLAFTALLLLAQACSSSLEKDFANPPDAYKPMPFWHINGHLTTEGIREQMSDARELGGFSGITPLPLATWKGKTGTTPRFLSEEYFARYQDILDVAEELDMQVILYDDNDFPSGMAGGRMESNFPDHTMKRLDMEESEVMGPAVFVDSLDALQLMAAVAMNSESLERIEISPALDGEVLHWEVPEGSWKIMLFKLRKDSFHKKYLCVDFLDTVAVKHMIDLTYEEYAARFSSYFGNTIQMTFFDDVGMWRHPYQWTGSFNEKFEELYGFDPRPYYPALWHRIGPKTEAARNALFNTRAELLAEGYPRLAARWNEEHGLKSTGHPPGNYDPTPVDMNGDIFKFYRYTQVPLMDYIKWYQFGRDGFKMISSAADYYDRPMVSTEIYGAFREHTLDSLMLYRALMDLLARGVNFVIPHGMWYDSDKVYIPPLVSPTSKKIVNALPAYSEFTGRSCLMLQGGRRVADIAVLYPIGELAGWYRFDDPDNPRQGFFISPITDYQEISRMLTNELRRDFTFLHPEFLLEEKYRVGDGSLYMDNEENFQEYSTVFITGCNTISWKALDKLKEFYDRGGKVVATTHLPTKSAEMDEDEKVRELVSYIFGMDPLEQEGSASVQNANEHGGQAIFVPEPNEKKLEEALQALAALPDVAFGGVPVLPADSGQLSYIHKVKEGRDIYYFTNSSDVNIRAEVLIRGSGKLERWDPHTGRVQKDLSVEPSEIDGQPYRKLALDLEAVSSVFYVGKSKPKQ